MTDLFFSPSSLSGSFTGAFTGDGSAVTGIVSASHAVKADTASVALTAPATAAFALQAISASHADTASLLIGFIESASFAATASAATSITFTPATASYALKSGIALSGTGSWTGSVTGNLQGSASFATTASAATSLTFIPTSASFATTASFASNVLKQASASHADVADLALSGTGSFTGTFIGDGANVLNVVSSSWASRSISASYADTASVLLGSITSASFATTSSYAVTASFATNAANSDTRVTFTSSLAPTQSWQTISSGSQHLQTGLYAFTLGANDRSLSGSADTLNYAGMVEWFAEATTGSDQQEREVVLHVSGKSQDSGSLYVRTFQSASVLLNLQLYSDYNLGTGSYAANYGWTFRKLL